MDLRRFCHSLARQLGWDGKPWKEHQKHDPGDHYQFLLDHLPMITLGASESNQTIDKIAAAMGWDDEYKAQYKTTERFVGDCFFQAFEHYKEVAKHYKEMESKIIPIQTELDKARQDLLDCRRDLDAMRKRQEKSSKI